MKTEAETGVMQPEAQGPLEPPEAEKGRKDCPLEPLEGAQPGRHVDFGLGASEL